MRANRSLQVGIIACAYGQQGTESAGPSNEAIGQTARWIRRATGGVIATQWEVEAFLKTTGEPANKVVSFCGTDSHYVTTKQVFEASLAYFDQLGITNIVIVAQPLHLKVIRLMMKQWKIDPRYSFVQSYDHLMKKIPYDRSEGNIQWWTRGPIRFGSYLVRSALSGIHGR